MRWNPLRHIEWKILKPVFCTPLAIIAWICVVLLLWISSHSTCCDPVVECNVLTDSFSVHIPHASCEKYYAVRYWSIDYTLMRLLFAVLVCHVVTICWKWRSLARKILLVTLSLFMYLFFFVFLVIRGLF